MSENDRKNGKKTGRDEKGRFGPGNPGKPKGARHKATVAALALLDGQAEAITRRAIEQALGGDTTALKLCLERILPARRDVPLPEGVDLGGELATDIDAIIRAVAGGVITPSEADALAKILESKRKIVELTEIEERLCALEEHLERKK